MSDETEVVEEDVAEEPKAEEPAEAPKEEPKEEPKAEEPKPEEEPKEADWREAIKDAKLKDHAGRFNSVEDVIRANLESRQKLSNAIVKPGKDASEEDIAAYRKAMNIPESKDGYDLKLPDEASEEQKASLEKWKEVFHEKGIPKDIAADLVAEVQKENEEAQKAIEKADKKYAEEQDAILKDEWRGDYDKNKTFGDRALSVLADRAGVDIEELRHMETKEGRFLLDDARLVRIFSAVGREMDEGDLGPVSGDEVERLQDQVEEIRKKISEAQTKGESRKANELFQKEQDLLRKLGSNAAKAA